MRHLRYLPFFLLLLLPGSALWWPASAIISGEVRDDHGPVADAVVRFQGQSYSVRSDADGRFILPRPTPRPERVVAWKDSYFIAGAAADALPLVLTLQPLPKEDCERYAWVDPAPNVKGKHNCGNCHAEMYDEWTASGHARSINNRRFMNLYDGSDWKGNRQVGWSLLADHPDGAGVCTSCHGPTVPFSDPAYHDLRQARGVAAQGVHCDYCHKIAGPDVGQVGQTHGRFGLKLLRPAEGQLFFGPLADVDRGDDVYSSFYGESRYCASCHEGTVFGVHVYSTYSEWLVSPARREGKQCQTCHMAPTGNMHNIAPGKGGLRRDPHTLANHRFFDGSQADMLRHCLQLTAVVKPGMDGVRVEVDLRVKGVGHRVPTGFVDRHLLLIVEGVDSAGKALAPLEGPTLPAVVGKELAGSPGRLYAKVLKDFQGHSPAPFWNADPAVVDTRLSPGKHDQITFRFAPGMQQVRVRLIHRRFWADVAASKGWPDDATSVVDQTLKAILDKETRWP